MRFPFVGRFGPDEGVGSKRHKGIVEYIGKKSLGVLFGDEVNVALV